MGHLRANISNFYTRQSVYGNILVGFSFLALTLLTVKTLAPQIDTDATSQTASQTVGPWSLSMANDSAVTINITPTSSQAVYTATNNLSVTNSCTAGATITMTTNSTASNSLTRAAVSSDRQYLSIPVYISSCRKNAVVSGLCGEAAVRVNTRKHRINRMGKTHFSIIL